jgi:repressor LexA
MEELTERQEEILNFLKAYVRDHGYPPTMREIGEHFGFTWPGARGHLRAIEKKGFIKINPLKARGLEVTGLRRIEGLELPVADRVRAGEPILAIEEIDEHIVVDKSLFKIHDAFGLRITGDSMIEAGIFDSDYVVVKPQKVVSTGDIAVVLIGDEVTVKRVSISKTAITLIPANKDLKPVRYKPDEISIIGKVIGVIRRL